MYKLDRDLNILNSVFLAKVTLSSQHGKKLISNETFCLSNDCSFDYGGTTIVDYKSMTARGIPSPKGFQLGAADNFGYIYGDKGWSYSTVTVLDSDGAVVEKLRLKGNKTYQDYFRYEDRVYVTTCTLGIHEFIGTREDETVTRVYRFEPEG